MKNLLFIYTDQQRYDTLACYGNERIEMPNLNRLADTATVFERAYVTQPALHPQPGHHPHRRHHRRLETQLQRARGA